MIKKPRIYIDTSVIGGWCDPEFSLWSQKLMNDFQMGLFIPVVSRLTEGELTLAPSEVLDVYSDLKEIDLEVLETSPEALGLRQIYLKREILSPKNKNDGLHIAIATVANVDIVVSWNFRHIVHFDKIRMFNAVNVEMGYRSIEIYSPREVINYGNQSG
jgi:hypothetical protein